MNTLCVVSRQIALDVIEALSKHTNIKINVSDQIMATQLKNLLGTRRIHEIVTDDLMSIGEQSPPLGCWIAENRPELIARAIHLTHESQVPQDE